MKYKTIFTPGPVPMYPETLALGAVQAPYFRNQDFSEVLLECEQLLLGLVNAPEQSRVVFLTASGTAGMESVVQNLLHENEQTLVINGGGFGQRFVNLCQLYAVPYIDYTVENDNLSDTQGLASHSNASALLINAHETSIGLLYNLQAIGEFCQQYNMLHIVDAISLFVTDTLDMQKQHIDALIVSSHKGLALPVGLTMVVLAPSAIAKVKPSQSLYFDFNCYLEDGKRGQTPFTPAITIVLQLQQRLRQLAKEGVDKSIEQAHRIAVYFREQIQGLPLQAYSAFMPNALTTLTPVDGRSAFQIVQDLDAQFDVVLTPNGGALKHHIFRVSHMGNMDEAYTDILLNALFDYYGVIR